ncbi:MAG: DUF4340 domain-containing protein [Planctomycetes bacterium]|nr:DUF4340 domain-containing protein [Planctomycetota bacterium]
MNPKTTVVLVIALLLAVGGVWWMQPSPDAGDKPAESSGPRPLFELKPDDITAYEIKQGETLTCSFVKEDGKWRMTSPSAGPAESFAVNGDVDKITGLEYEEHYAGGHADRPSNEITSLDKPLKIVKLTGTDGKSTVLKIGEGQKLSRKTYVQVEGNDTIYVVNSDLHADLKHKLSDYRGKRVAEFKVGEAVRVQVSGSENYTLVKSGLGWALETPVKARADLTLVNKIISTVANLSALEFVADDPKSLRPYGLDNPRLVVSVTTEQKTPKKMPDIEGPTSAPVEPEFDIKTSVTTVALGGKAEDRVFARVVEPASPVVFQVNESVAKDVSVGPADLREKKIASIAIERANRIVLTTGAESIELVRAGPLWQIAGAADSSQLTPAEFVAVDDLLKAVRDAKALSFEESESAEFGFANPRATLEISVEGELNPFKLLVGGMTPSKTGAYVKIVSDQVIAVIPTAGADAMCVKPVSFRTRDILSFDSSNATRIEMVGGGNTRVIEKVGESWNMTAPVQGRAEPGNVTRILADLSSLRGRRVVALAADAPNYGLNETATKVSITVTPPAPSTQPSESLAAQGAIVHTLLFSRHGGLVYAMKADGPTICEIDAKVLNDIESELLDTKLFDVQSSLVRSFASKGASNYQFDLDGDTWKLSGESSFAVDASKLTTLFDSFRELRAVRYVKYNAANLTDYGLDAPETVLVVTQEGGDVSTLHVSAKGPSDGGRYAVAANAPDRVFVIKAEDVTKLIKKVTDFQKGSGTPPPETP